MATHKVIGVVEHDLTAKSLNLVWGDALESALSSNRHEDWGVHRSVREGQDSGTSLCGPAFGDNIPLEGRFHDARGEALNVGSVDACKGVEGREKEKMTDGIELKQD